MEITKGTVGRVVVVTWVAAFITSCCGALTLVNTCQSGYYTTCTGSAVNGGSVAIVVILFVVYFILALAAWVLGMISTAQIHRWGWFVAIMLTSLIGATIYAIAGPDFPPDDDVAPAPNPWPAAQHSASPANAPFAVPAPVRAQPVPPVQSVQAMASANPVPDAGSPVSAESGPASPSPASGSLAAGYPQPQQPPTYRPAYPPPYSAPYSTPLGAYPPPFVDVRASAQVNMPMAVAPTSQWAIWSLVCSILGFFTFVTAIPGVIFGHLALNEIKKNPRLEGRGLAIAGLIMGYIVVGLAALAILFYVVVIIIVLVAAATQQPH